jgi:hypothetical protein
LSQSSAGPLQIRRQAWSSAVFSSFFGLSARPATIVFALSMACRYGWKRGDDDAAMASMPSFASLG